MKNPLSKIKRLIPNLPKKDVDLANKYLEKRDFVSILEIVQSDLYKARKANDGNEISDDYIINLTELEGELILYMSYLDISDDLENYEYY